MVRAHHLESKELFALAQLRWAAERSRAAKPRRHSEPSRRATMPGRHAGPPCRAAKPRRHSDRSEAKRRNLPLATGEIPRLGKLSNAEPPTTGDSLRFLRLRSGTLLEMTTFPVAKPKNLVHRRPEFPCLDGLTPGGLAPNDGIR